ncbi:MAG: phosphoenolpyruvate carboxykinase (ATP) [Candidatus Bipolaricaulota bacterium]|nr:phosphoenolpyruvate carboxykinase (ATP) [Candidatus Bipolaricaulota bacterium]
MNPSDDFKRAYRNLSVAQLYEEALRRREAQLSHTGALVAYTGRYTGRSPQDKFIVKEPSSANNIWWGAVNQPLSTSQFENLYGRLCDYLKTKELFVQDLSVCTVPRYRIPIRVITEYAWHSLFARNLFIRASDSSNPQITVICAPNFHADPKRDGTRSETFIVLHPQKKLILIGGTQYAGEIKKSVFTLLNYLLPQQNILPMHCSANLGPDGDTALFFGLSGTGKTTLSTNPHRPLIGDDEHGWSDEGIFNFEGGCYAKVIQLREESEPEIYRAVQRFGSLVENVPLDPQTRVLNFDDASITENTRAAYPIEFLPRFVPEGAGPHPRTIFFLSYDAFGVLPPISRLSPDQVITYCLLGYTAKVAGTERGVVAPTATFSACFGAPFWPLPPQTYATMLRKRLAQHRVDVWLLNTGILGEPGSPRISIAHTRALLRAALNGSFRETSFEEDRYFGLRYPARCAEAPQLIMNPQHAWKDQKAYQEAAQQLAERFAQQINSSGGTE